jgi:ribosomal-protein-serine acetyltransferase
MAGYCTDMEPEIRERSAEDAEALGRAIAESLEHLRPWMAWIATEPVAVEDRRRDITQRAGGEDGYYLLWLGDRVVGAAGLHPRIAHGGLELGYWVHVDFTGRGYATLMARRMVELAFARPQIDHLEIHHDVANVASGVVAAAAGFTDAGTRATEPKAPADSGTQRVWRLARPRE